MFGADFVKIGSEVCILDIQIFYVIQITFLGSVQNCYFQIKLKIDIYYLYTVNHSTELKVVSVILVVSSRDVPGRAGWRGRGRRH